MNCTTPLLSIIIPTRNRISYCISAMESILSIQDPRLELVVQDNSDCSELYEYVNKNFTDSRLKYRFTSNAYSTIDNFNEAMELSTGEYVCFIGDDDGINPEIIVAAEWARRNQIDALSWNIKANYLWPGTISTSAFFSNVSGGKLTIHPFTCEIRKINQEKELKSFLKSGGCNYLKFKLPKAYHGLVSRSCFNKVKVETGNYYGGLSPDIYASLSIASIAKVAYFIDYPLSIAGSSPISELTHNSKEAKLLPLVKAPHLRNRGKYIWNEIVPFIYTGSTIQLDSGLNALTLMKRTDLISDLNTSRMNAHCVMAYPQFKNEIIEHAISVLRSQNNSILIGLLSIKFESTIHRLRILVSRGGNRLLLILGIRKVYSHENQDTIFSATNTLIRHLYSKNQSFSKYIKNI